MKVCQFLGRCLILLMFERHLWQILHGYELYVLIRLCRQCHRRKLCEFLGCFHSVLKKREVDFLQGVRGMRQNHFCFFWISFHNTFCNFQCCSRWAVCLLIMMSFPSGNVICCTNQGLSLL